MQSQVSAAEYFHVKTDKLICHFTTPQLNTQYSLKKREIKDDGGIANEYTLVIK